MFVDVHCHLSFPEFDTDRKAIVEAMERENVSLLIDPGTDVESSRKAIELAAGHSMIYANVGLHPHETSLPVPGSVFSELAELARKPKVVAIGEIGLDYHYPDHNPSGQQEAFRTMLRIARELDLPVVIHCRDAWDDLFTILDEERSSSLRGMMHCFSGDIDIARRSIRLGLEISIPGTITYKRSTLPEVVREIPIRHLLTETDAPYLSPVPYRGKQNSPLNVRLVTEAIAVIQDKSMEKTAECIGNNAKRLFRLA